MDHAGKAAVWIFEHARTACNCGDGHVEIVRNFALGDVLVELFNNLPASFDYLNFFRGKEVINERIQKISILTCDL